MSVRLGNRAVKRKFVNMGQNKVASKSIPNCIPNNFDSSEGDNVAPDTAWQATRQFIFFDFSEIRNVVNQDNSILQEYVGGSSLQDFKLWEAK